MNRSRNTDKNARSQVWFSKFVYLLLFLARSVPTALDAATLIMCAHERTVATACKSRGNVISRLAKFIRKTGRFSSQTTRNMIP